jgi:uncharacterized protein with GYD domain
MVRYVVLLNFTEKGVAAVKASIDRVEAFQSAAAKAGATVEGICWTLGPYDGAFVFCAPDETTAAAIVLEASRGTSAQP